MTPGFIDEIVFIDLLALFLSVAVVEIVWYSARRALPNEVDDFKFFATFVLVIVPFVMLIFFGLAIINYDAMAIRSGWSPALPLKSALSPPIVGAAVFYVGQTAWLWWSWRSRRSAHGIKVKNANGAVRKAYGILGPALIALAMVILITGVVWAMHHDQIF